MVIDQRGVTRVVILTRRWAIKLPRGLRGWLANQSEWRRRRAPQVNAPIATAVHFAAIYPRAVWVGHWPPEYCPAELARFAEGNDELKGSSWGMVDGRWLLIDFDRAWEEQSWPLGRLYYWNQERLARKWSKLPSAESYDARSNGRP